MLDETTIQLVKATVPVISAHGQAVTSIFYRNLLTDHPSLNATFNQGNQVNGHQSRALASAVLAYATYLDRPQALGPAITHITQKHASLFVKPEQYDVVGRYLLDAFGEVLGDAFTPQIRNAWAVAYGELAATMIAAEAALYKEAEDWTDWRNFTVERKTPESSEIISFILRPDDGRPLPTYLPGQYISIRAFVPSLGYTQIRQYSLSDSSNPEHYRISVKRETGIPKDGVPHPGLVSSTLHDNVKVGDKVQLSYPRGEFAFVSDGNTTSPLVLISAGVGITPMMSILNTVLTETPSRPLSWIHGANSSDKRAFLARLSEVERDNKNVGIIRFVTTVQSADKPGLTYDHIGRINLDELDNEQDLFTGDRTSQYFVCGPDAFMTKMREQLLERDVASERIRIETFGTGGF